ncbi:unannotated protein [freshwater metagenome]|uniref:Unannotated protein n=1 Tax=freshwater metagenome TaxID=449393 RepID=A0A6J6I6K5_9ZZZZ
MDNFLQEDLFADILPPVSSDSSLTRSPIPGSKSPSLKNNALAHLPEFRVIRSSRRKRSIQAFRTNGIIEIHIPAKVSRKQELELIPEMIALVLKREAKSRKSDEELVHMSAELLGAYLPEFTQRPASVAWKPMRERWGSCTTVDRTIRISSRLEAAPDYVIRFVLFHELIHLRIPGHGDDFYALLDRMPDKDRAESFLEGYEAGIAAHSLGEEITPL